MRICFVAPASSLHMVKWCGYFVEKGHEVHIITFDRGQIDGVIVHKLDAHVSAWGSDLQKLAYLACFREARRTLYDIKPDVVNAHYATSYGTLAALACEMPYILSVWGSDIYDFPKKTPLHRAMLKFSLRRAAKLMSTSKAMAEEASKYVKAPYEITPFGVDTRLFQPHVYEHGSAFVISVVKALSPKYGIDVLLEACAEVVARRPDIPLRVRIAGKGPDELMLKVFAQGLDLDGRVEWLGYISQEQAAEVWADADVGVVPSSSVSESFGVAAIEAQACGTPVIVSDTPGLMEAVVPGKSALVFPKGSAHDLADCIIDLYDDVQLRRELGDYGRQFVTKHYDLDSCFSRIESSFEAFVETEHTIIC